ncbi:hypothetical protein M0812_28496 [Anaeramoeba flamelloides]|uniref:Calcineurin-like phosphoesterase domain-containing protein n=1 Tax=Anaeramoeba flamelloides TaxID=1746091 RepID=A0AAV7YBP6_9EUKA|nr:hypothetical protein M0812_28496 [Anaeramoeba flamelloides]
MKFQSLIFLIIFCCLISPSLSLKQFLKFNQDGEFKIAQFSDLHFGDQLRDGVSKSIQRILLDIEKPDFVVLTGDIITGEHCHTVAQTKRAWYNTVKELVKRNIPWGIAFGNHEYHGIMTVKELMYLDQTYPLSQSEFGPEDIKGVSNYHLEIHTHDSTPDEKEVAVVLYFLDSGDIWCEDVFGYSCVHYNQIEWFKKVSSEFTKQYPNHLGIVLFHIPLPEGLEFWHTDISYGLKLQTNGCPKYNTGLYQTMVENGNIKLVLNGHDHNNDYCTRSKHQAPDLWLCNGRKTGYGGYNPDHPIDNGARIIQLYKDKKKRYTFSTWIRDRQRQKIIQPLHKPDCDETEKCNLSLKQFLKFNQDGEFKIAQFTDLHFGQLIYDEFTLMVQRLLLDMEKPDFVVFTGDQLSGSYSETEYKAKSEWNNTVKELVKRNIPWGMTFGNHDDQGIMTRKELMNLDKSYPLSQSEFGPVDITGVSNYYLEIHTADSTPDEKEVAVVLYFLDSGDKGCMGYKGWGCVHPDQIDWFKGVSSEFTKQYPNHMGIVLFHIPVPEMLDFWHADISYGLKKERCCCPLFNTELYQAMVENGNIKLVLNGHDHRNDYCTRSVDQAPDLWMCYGRKTGYGYYNPIPPMYNGARIIQLHNDKTEGTTYTTWIRDQQKQKIVSPMHEPDHDLNDKCDK